MRLAPLAVVGLTAVVAVPAAAEPHQAVVARLALGDLDGAASAWAWAAGGSADALAQVAVLWLGLSDEVRAATHAEALERRACEAWLGRAFRAQVVPIEEFLPRSRLSSPPAPSR